MEHVFQNTKLQGNCKDRVGSEAYLSKLLPVGLNTPKCEVKPEQFSYKGLVLYRLELQT